LKRRKKSNKKNNRSQHKKTSQKLQQAAEVYQTRDRFQGRNVNIHSFNGTAKRVKTVKLLTPTKTAPHWLC
jgi:hypothetical protein